MSEAQSSASLNRFLHEQLNTKIEHVTTVLEKEGESLFTPTNVFSQEEIADYIQEFLELFFQLLHRDAQLDQRTDERLAVRQFFLDFARQLHIRGGDLEVFLRYIQFMQATFLGTLGGEEGEEESFTLDQARTLLLQLTTFFNDLSLEVLQDYLAEKERTIEAQQDELRQTSSPITEIWDGVLTLPIIGTLDSSRTMIVMEKLLSRIEAERAKVVVMDVTGVTAIDSQVSHHLIQMVRAIGLMGASAVLTGIRPEVARSLTSLNIDLGDVQTRSTLSEGLKEAFRQLNIRVTKEGG